jgi:hypothetical protein
MKAPFWVSLAVIAIFTCTNVAFCQGIRITSPLPVGTSTNPTGIEPNAAVAWNIDDSAVKPAVLQIYLNNELIYPQGNPNKESAPGLTAQQLGLQPGNTYELKMWIPRTMINVSTWVFITGR